MNAGVTTKILLFILAIAAISVSGCASINNNRMAHKINKSLYDSVLDEYLK
jgi:hypothetical protein